jgi:hypothetical protein
MSVFRVRKVAFINFGLLLIFLASWISWYIYPVARSITKEFSSEYGFAAAEFEDHVFYGKVSYAAIPSLFGGSNIPFFDKIFFQINGDSGATFVLYANDEILDRMAVPALPSPIKARNYAMAQKPAGVRLTWVCNWKHAMHSSPCGCAKPQLGGKWVILGPNMKNVIKDDNK